MSDTDRPPVRNREWIAEILDCAEIVQWDRFVVEQHDRGQHIRVYGWIERDGDDYKDFVIVRLWPDSETFGFTTSSDEYSETLHRLWFGEETLDDHNPCRRVEHAFDIENAVELNEQPTRHYGKLAQHVFFGPVSIAVGIGGIAITSIILSANGAPLLDRAVTVLAAIGVLAMGVVYTVRWRLGSDDA